MCGLRQFTLHNQLTNSKFIRPITKISKSSQLYGGQFRLIYARLARGNNLPPSFRVHAGSWKRLGYPGGTYRQWKRMALDDSDHKRWNINWVLILELLSTEWHLKINNWRTDLFLHNTQPTEWAKKVCPKLRDSAWWRSGEITQPRTNFFGQLCIMGLVA